MNEEEENKFEDRKFIKTIRLHGGAKYLGIGSNKARSQHCSEFRDDLGPSVNPASFDIRPSPRDFFFLLFFFSDIQPLWTEAGTTPKALPGNAQRRLMTWSQPHQQVCV